MRRRSKKDFELRSETKKGKWRERIFRYAPLFLWIAVIFTLSSDAGAMTKTSRFIRPLLEFLFPSASEDTLLFYHGIIRKGAHLTEYGVLAFFAARAFMRSAVAVLSKYWWFTAVLLPAIVAVIDEANQSRLASRTGSVGDVGIDIAGAILMVSFLSLFKDRWPVKHLL